MTILVNINISSENRSISTNVNIKSFFEQISLLCFDTDIPWFYSLYKENKRLWDNLVETLVSLHSFKNCSDSSYKRQCKVWSQKLKKWLSYCRKWGAKNDITFGFKCALPKFFLHLNILPLFPSLKYTPLIFYFV